MFSLPHNNFPLFKYVNLKYFFFSGNLFGHLLAGYVQLYVQPYDLLFYEQQVSFS